MFNVIISIHELFLLTAISLLLILSTRLAFIKKRIFIFLFYSFLFVTLFVGAVGGGGVQNIGYDILEQFTMLEKKNELEHAQKNPQNYDAYFASYLTQFKTSKEFKEYLQSYDPGVDKAEALFIGLFFALLAEIAIAFAKLVDYFARRNKKIPVQTKP